MPTSQQSFIKAMSDMDSALTDIGLSYRSTEKKGSATYVNYEGANCTQVTFMFGPSDWHVEITIERNCKTYEFKDLLQIPSVGPVDQGQ